VPLVLHPASQNGGKKFWGKDTQEVCIQVSAKGVLERASRGVCVQRGLVERNQKIQSPEKEGEAL
jgi:hypothetical protein